MLIPVFWFIGTLVDAERLIGTASIQVSSLKVGFVLTVEELPVAAV